MKKETKENLIRYVYHLIHEEGLGSVRVDEVIPSWWTQFPVLPQEELHGWGLVYDRHTGWFRPLEEHEVW